MASEAEPRLLGMFECQLCALTAPYSYVGQKPPDTHAVVAVPYAIPAGSIPCWLFLRTSFLKSPGGKLHHEGSLLLRQSQVSGPWLTVQCVWQTGVCGPGLQPVLLQEGLPPLCSGEYQCFPSGNTAGCGKEKRGLQEALQPSLTGRHTASCAALG